MTAQFENKLHSIFGVELAESIKAEDYRRGIEMVEALTRAAAVSIAVVCKGDPKTIDDELERITYQMFEQAAGAAKVGREIIDND